MPLVSSSAKPVAIDIVPKVTMNGEIAQKGDADAVDQADDGAAAEAREHAGQDDQAGLVRERVP